jgi:hypothetical protein
MSISRNDASERPMGWMKGGRLSTNPGRPGSPRTDILMKTTKAGVLKSAQKLQDGITKHFGKTKTILIDGKLYKPAELTKALQAVLDRTADAEKKKAAYHDAIVAQDSAAAVAQPLALGIARYAYMALGQSNESLADFGLTPRKRRQPTVKTKAAAQDKAAATRVARGTKAKGAKGGNGATASGATAGAGPASKSAPTPSN